MMKKEQLFKAAGIIAAASILSKILGFGRETSMAAVFGASHATDAYLVANIIPGLLFATVGTALTTTLIPVYTRRVYEEGEHAGWQFINSLPGSHDPGGSHSLRDSLIFLEAAGAGILHRLRAPRRQAPAYGFCELREDQNCSRAAGCS